MSRELMPSEETILVVDDHPASLQLLARILFERGYKVRVAPGGFLALQSIQLKLPDLILLDILMPEIDGYEICRRLKADQKTQQVPIIFLSTLGESIDRVRAFAAGGADYMTKPFQVEEAIIRIENQLSLLRLQKQFIAKTDRLQQEISEREKAQAELKKSEERWQLVLLGNNDGIWDWDIRSNQTIRSDRFAEVLGYEPHEISSSSEEWSDRIHPDDLDRVVAANQDYLQKKTPHYIVEYRLRRKDGSYTWVLNRGQAQWDGNGNPIRMVGSMRDISDRKQAEAALRDGEARYRLMSENSTDLISRHTLAGVFLYASPACRLLLGYEPEELVGRSISEFFHPDDADLQAASLPQTATFSYRARCKDGGYIWLETTIRVVCFPELGSAQEAIAVSRDITERKRAEDALAQQLDHILLLQQITEAIRSQLDTQQIFETAVLQIGYAFKVSRCAILVHTAGSLLPLTTVAEHQESHCASLLEIETPIVGNPYVIKVLEQESALASPHVFTDLLLEPVADWCEQVGLKSMLAVRTSYQGQPNGIITLHQCDRFRDWTLEEINLLEAVAAQVSIALDQANLLAQEQKQREALDYHNLILRTEIRERRKAETALQDSEAELRGLFAAMTDIVLVMDAEGRYLEIAPTNPDNLYKPASLLLGKTLADVFPTDQANFFLDCIRQTLATQQTLEFDYSLEINDPARVAAPYRTAWFTAKASPISERAVIWVAHDITARQQAEAELRASEERWHLAVEGGLDGIADVDLVANEAFFSQRWKKNLGYEDLEISRDNREWSDRIHPDDFDRVMAANQSYLARQTPQYYIEYRLRCKDGSYKWMVTRGQAIWDEQGNPRRLVVTTGDISDRKRVEAERKQAAAELLETTATLADFSNSLKQLHRLSITSFADVEALCREYLRTGCELLGFSTGMVGRVEEQTFTIHSVESSFLQLQIGMSLELEDVYCKEVVRQRKTIAYAHIGANEELRSCQLHHDLNLESYISTPIFVDEAIFGTLCFFATEVRLNFNRRETEIIELMAQSIGKFMSAHLLETQRQRAEEEVQLLLDITQAITAAADFNQALEVALRALCETTNWIYGEIWLPAADHSVLECSPIWYCNREGGSDETIAAIEQFRQTLANVTFQPNEGIAGRVWSRQRPEWIPDVEDPSTSVPHSVSNPQLRSSPAKDFGMKARFGMPITVVSGDLGDSVGVAAQHRAIETGSHSRGQSTVVAVLVFFMVESRQQDERLIQLVAAVATQLGTVLAQKQAEAEMRALFSAMTDLVMVRDASGRCLKVVAPASPNLYKPPQEMLGRTLHETLPAPVADFLLYGIQASLTTQETVNLEYNLTIRDREVWLSASISPLSENTVILVARDISAAKISEADRQRQEQALRLIVEGTAAKTGSEFLRFLVRYLAEVLEVRYSIVAQVADAPKLQVQTLAVWQGDDFGNNFEYNALGLPCQKVLEGEVCYHPDSVSSQFPGCEIFTQLGVESYLGIPLIDSIGNVLGSLKVMDVKPMTDDPSRQLILRIFAARAGAELERKLADDALRESAERERATLRIVERMRQSLELDQIFRAATDELRHLLKCDRVAIYRFNPDWSGGFVAESVAAGWMSIVQEHVHDPTLTEAAFESDRCVVKNWDSPSDIFQDTHLQDSKGGAYSQGKNHLSVSDIYAANFAPCYVELLERFQARAYVTVPIFQGSTLWGLLANYQNSGSRVWKETEISLVIHISTQLGVALQQADLLAQTQHQAAQLERARDAAEAASRAKSEFLASMSHELRTPLNAILGFTQLMSRETSLSPDNQSNLGIINSSGQHLLGLINDVLEMSKIEAGRVKLNENSFDLYRLLDGLEETLRLKANAKRLALTFDRGSEIPQFIISDESKLRQVLLNLLGNAIKFTPQGSVTLRVQGKPGDGAIDPPLTQHLFFEIADTGLGIASDEMERLFKPFMQTKTGQQSNDGTGLGLTLSQKFVNLMGGNITVKSVVNQGSTFRFEIPVRLSQMSLTTPRSTRRVISLAPDQPTYRLLVVEDQLENSQLLVKLLVPLGFEVYRAKNGREAIALWQSWSPHLILMDMRMPVMNGYQATEQIKATVKGQATIIIAVTGSAFEEERSEILAIGCNDFIRKPFQQEEIFAKLAEHLGVKYLYEAVEPEAEPPIELTRTDLEIMSDEWIEQLEQAASGCSDRQVFHLLEQIPPSHAFLSKTLGDMAYNFHFEEIVDLINSAKP